MWKKKKKNIVIIGVIAAVVVAGSITGIAIAQTNTPPKPDPSKTLMGRAAAILGIDQQKLQSAFDQANRDMQNEALDNRLKSLVDQGKMTQDQADQYKKWWQSKPNITLPVPGPMQGPVGPGFRMPRFPVTKVPMTPSAVQ
jgi:hypothetical protein